ncbi:hypothetical protein [Xanthobacter flavus]|uniref:hypothetical protein n=1 Tax=Xanthobacter flavus TaxID=281 RepID=UPI00372799D7
MSALRSAPRHPADDNLHPIHRSDRRLAEIRAASLRVLLVVAAAPIAASLVSILVLAVRP